jgi:uncharacterized protein with PQ loop repeat
MSYELRHVISRNTSNGVPAEEKDSSLKKALDKIAYPVALIGPLSSIDQAISIWREQSADGVSVIVWVVLLFTSTFWMIYGIIHREKVILFGHIVWFVLCSIILTEIVFFL